MVAAPIWPKELEISIYLLEIYLDQWEKGNPFLHIAQLESQSI